MKRLVYATALVLVPLHASAQTTDRDLTTVGGQEITAILSGYRYVEPGNLAISISGPKFGGEYTGTVVLNTRHHWYAQGNLRGTAGGATYTGWCMPWLITPNSSSPNGYELDLGEPSTCSESGDKDWYVEGRGMVGKDLGGASWGWSPYAGLGLRFLSNGTSGVPGFRTDRYLYSPIGLTARTRVGSHPLSVNVEIDPLVRGWQNTHNSQLGGGTVPATPTAPAFTINGISDIAFDQHGGWALRAGARYSLTKHWAAEPYYIHWSVRSSQVNYQTATFTVNNVTAHEQLGAYEPFNTTNEVGVKLSFRF